MRRGGGKSSLFRSFPNSKKGLSTVITSLLLILLAIVVIGIIWVVVSNIIKNASSGISFDKFSLDLGIKSAYIDGSQVKVDVRRSAGAGNLTGVYFIFHNGTSSTNVKRAGVLNELEERTFTFSSQEVGGVSTVNLVSVSPVYSSGGSDVIGGITDTAEIRTSPPSGAGGTTGQTGGTTGGNETGGTTGNQTGNETGGNNNPFCGNGICEQSETSGTCAVDCALPPTCNGVWEGASEDPGIVCDGGAQCLVGCACPTGFIGDGTGGCVSEPSINRGIVESVWPSGAVKYLDSNDLPKNSAEIVSFIGGYVNFSGAGGETRCLQISYAEYLQDPAYNKSYVRLELSSTVLPGDLYEVWTSPTCGA